MFSASSFNFGKFQSRKKSLESNLKPKHRLWFFFFSFYSKLKKKVQKCHEFSAHAEKNKITNLPSCSIRKKNKLRLLMTTVFNAQLTPTCQNISACISVSMNGRPKWSQRPGWACTESCARQLPVAASDRHGTALISWPVTIDTHSCAALGEQAEHRQRLEGAANTQTLMNTSKTSCHCLQDNERHLILLPERSCCCFTYFIVITFGGEFLFSQWQFL